MVPNKLAKILYSENVIEDHKKRKKNSHNDKRTYHQPYPFPANVLPYIPSSCLTLLFTGVLVQIHQPRDNNRHKKQAIYFRWYRLDNDKRVVLAVNGLLL
jgi:hypothetical protein